MRSRRTLRRSSGLLLALLFLSNFIVPHAAPPVRTTQANPDAPTTATRAETSAHASTATVPQPMTTTVPQPVAAERAASALAQLPLRFEANRGQTDGRVKFLSRLGGYTLFLTPDEAVWSLGGDASVHADASAAVLRMKLAGADTAPAVEGLEALPGGSNYLIGSDRSRWVGDVPGFAKVQYKAVYPGVDLVYYGAGANLEYDFRLAPGADPRQIKLTFSGAQAMRLDAASGDLVLRVGGRELRQHAPVAYQEKDGARRPVVSRYRIAGRRAVGFELGEYDRSAPLVIDPTLTYSTYVGGSTESRASGIAVDAQGNAYITGYTGATDFPTTPGALQTTNHGGPFQHTDYFVTKVNATGTALVYSTYLGGSGDEATVGGGIAVDAQGNAYVTGGTASADFPTTPGVFQTTKAGAATNSNAFVAKLNPSGNALVYSTFLGGGDDVAYGIAVDAAGDACVTGATGSPTFPVTAGAFQTQHAVSTNSFNADAFVSELNPTGTALIYSTFLGGSGDENFNYSGIAVDAAGKIYVAGKSAAAGLPTNTFPTTPGAFQTTYGGGTADAFAAKFDPTLSGAASLVYSTFLGGNSLDGAIGIAVDADGNAYVTGGTFSLNYPTTPGAFQTTYGGSGDFFVTKLNPSGTGAVYSTYIGGSGNEAGFAIALDADGHAWVAGQTYSPNYPVTADAYQHALAAPDYDVAVTKLSADGSSLEYSTYLGGGNTDFGTGVAVDSNGDAYVTGYVGAAGFPTTPGSFQSSYGAGRTGFQPFIAKLGPAAPADTTPPTVTCGSPDGLWHSTDISIQCTASDTGSGLADPADASFLLSTHVPAGTETNNASTDSRTVCDLAGNCATAGPVGGNKVDKKAPSASCASADGAWHATDVQIACAATDGGSGLANAGDASFSLSTSVPAGTEDSNASTDSRAVCDAVGNCTSAGPVAGNRIDKKGPTITINSPTANGYSLGTSVAASYTCSDAGSGVATCTGTVSSGSPIDTSSFGAKSFTVTATDNVGNTSTQTVTYNVTYNVCLAYNPKAVYQAGSTIPIKLSVCDPNGNNLSSSAVALRAVGVGLVSTAVFGDVDSSGGANPDGDFRLVGGFYVFNMSTKGLATGSYYLYFTVGSDPTLHTAPFQLK